MSFLSYFMPRSKVSSSDAFNRQLADLRATIIDADRRIERARTHPMERYFAKLALAKALSKHDELTKTREDLLREDMLMRQAKGQRRDVSSHEHDPYAVRRKKPIPAASLGVHPPVTW